MNVLHGGIIGFGNVGKSMMEYIKKHKSKTARITAVCSRSQSTLEYAEKKYGVAVTNDLSKFLSMDLDFVLVLSPNNTHADIVVEAARMRKHVFCEKPIALSLKDADRMIAAVEEAGVINVVNYPLRYLTSSVKLKEILQKGMIGEPLSLWSFRSRGYGLYAGGARHSAIINAEASGGWCIHHACHDADLLYWLNGPVKSVYSNMKTTAPESEEVILSNIEFKNGAMGMIGDSVCCLSEQYAGIIGTEGSVVINYEGEKPKMRYHKEGGHGEIPVGRGEVYYGGLCHF